MYVYMYVYIYVCMYILYRVNPKLRVKMRRLISVTCCVLTRPSHALSLTHIHIGNLTPLLSLVEGLGG